MDPRPIFPVTNSAGDKVEAWWFWCPGCERHHAFFVNGSQPGGNWTRTGTDDAPTFSPSLLNTWNEPSGDKRCHLFVRDGQIEYCGDCHHALAGKTVPLTPEPPEAA